MSKRKEELKNKNLAHQNHCDFLDKLEEMALAAFDSIMKMAISDVVKAVKKKNLKNLMTYTVVGPWMSPKLRLI